MTELEQQRWNPDAYAADARFVTDLGLPVVELLAPRPGERILDLGCGTARSRPGWLPWVARWWGWTAARR
jgi:trans-aconitate methyltransferase